MRIVSWNVNSLRVRLDQVERFLREQQPDVLALQETKSQDPEFPAEVFERLGYRSFCSGQKTYNGVAILSRHGCEDVVRGFPDDPEDADRRVLGATVGEVMQEELPKNPYNGLRNVRRVASVNDANNRTVSNPTSFGWNYYYNNASDPPVAIIWANSDDDTEAVDDNGDPLPANEL